MTFSLSADAPVFVPPFAVVAHPPQSAETQQHKDRPSTSTSSNQDHHNNHNTKNDMSKGRRRRGHGHRSSAVEEEAKQPPHVHSKTNHRSRGGKGKSALRNKSPKGLQPPSSFDSSRTDNPSLLVEQQKQQFFGKKHRDRRTRSRKSHENNNRQDDHIVGSNHQIQYHHYHDQDYYYDHYHEADIREHQADVIVEEDSFPALTDEPTHAVHQTHNNTVVVSGPWSNTSSLITDLASDPSKDPPLQTTPRSDFEASLQRGALTLLKPSSRRKRQLSSCPASSSLSIGNKNNYQQVQKDNNGTSLQSLDEEESSGAKHPTWNMNKLRYRLWEMMQSRSLAAACDKNKSSNSEKDQIDDETNQLSDSGDDESVKSLAPIPQHNSLISGASSRNTSSPQQQSALDPVYADAKYPLLEAIQRNDEFAVRVLLRNGLLVSTMYPEKEDEDDTAIGRIDPFQLAVHLGLAKILHILVSSGSSRALSEDRSSSTTTTANKDSNCWPPAPCLAAVRGQAECLAIFLESSTTYMLAKDSKGNNVMHILCRKKTSTSLLATCFDRLRSDASSSLISKIICQKNQNGQTPLHVACSNGRADLVERFLGFASISLLSKVLAIQDDKEQTPLLAAVASASTDTVMNLLMWSGNNSLAVQNNSLAVQKETFAPSPLLWAVRSLRADMVILLLEFFSGAGNKVELDETLRAAVDLKPNIKHNRIKAEMIRHLVVSGADPCAEDGTSNLCALEIAANKCDQASLGALLDSFDGYLKCLRSSRRRDPVLQRQPESYFVGLESREKARFRVALRNALVNSLAMCWKAETEELQRLTEDCTLLLFRKGAALDSIGLEMLRKSVNNKNIIGCTAGNAESYYSIWHKQPPFPNQAKISLKKFSGLYGHDDIEKSRLLWSITAMHASWFSEHEQKHFQDLSLTDGDFLTDDFDVVLVAENGGRFDVHSTLLEQKSDKLAAAIRFARMKSAADSSLVEIDIPASETLCRFLVQHMYHDSIITGLPKDSRACCNLLLDLVVLAEHLLCESLLQECEIRLLSENPRGCLCCFCAKTKMSTFGKYQRVCAGPSKCVTPETCLDILATADSLEEFFLAVSYRIRIPAWSSSTNINKVSLLRPFRKLRQLVFTTCLADFQRVIESEGFISQVSASSGEVDEFKYLLLRCCLEKFFSESELIVSEYLDQDECTECLATTQIERNIIKC